MQIFRRSLSGDVGRNLVPLTFPTDEVMDGATHARLTRLNQTALDDDEALNAFSTRSSPERASRAIS